MSGEEHHTARKDLKSMGKKSARSKGYRKTYKPVVGYTKTEKNILLYGSIALVIILACVLWLPDFIDSLGYLRVKKGVVQNVEDNWLICDVSDTDKNKYLQLGTMGDVEGFELVAVEAIGTDTNLKGFTFEPTAEDSVAKTVQVYPGDGEAYNLCTNYKTMLPNFVGEVLYMDEMVLTEEYNGLTIYSFLAEYRSEIIEEETDETAEAAEETEPRYQYAQQAVAYIDSNIYSDISLDLMAEHFGITKMHIIRVFKRKFGITPMQYLIDKKISVAKSLLCGTVMPIKEIASLLRYSNTQHFSSSFKTATGITPNKYRQAKHE
jgi:AraC-like DNA-binding protein